MQALNTGICAFGQYMKRKDMLTVALQQKLMLFSSKKEKMSKSGMLQCLRLVQHKLTISELEGVEDFRESAEIFNKMCLDRTVRLPMSKLRKKSVLFTKCFSALASDASPIGVHCVLSYIYPDGSEQPIAFGSKTEEPKLYQEKTPKLI
ncbi:hypothetical protein AVEN_125044-1 [Araneus ventricosus]|uniref:Reverse transcriptase/retrotransposon-derived protein RNase H-like domain-containing protein n=1 Tax=Araneus ventricosus TaxID=182803 RepID=A0A4Y2TT19_ARAVE|nr:hypothetical protein AVEN_125044-1 [Araneus ventricosus]